MSFKEEFAALCKKYNVVFDVTDRREVYFYTVGVAVSEEVTIVFDADADHCEFVTEKML